MKKNLLLLLTIILPVFIQAQASIICPPDLSINAVDLDDTFSSYGDPIVTDGENLNLTREVAYIYNGCANEFGTIITLTYGLVDPSTSQQIENCDQRISLRSASLDDVIFPSDITLENISINDAKPSITGQPNLFTNSSNLFFTWTDEVLNQGNNNNVKIIREWTGLDWCTGLTLKDEQIISINNVLSPVGNPATILTCSGEEITIDDVIVDTDDPEVVIDQSGCSLENNDITGFINCITNLNPIKGGHKYSIDIIKNGATNGSFLNGVSTLDMVMIQRHILQIETFDNPCKIAASDLSNEGNITVVDLVELRKLILGIYTVLPNSPSWKFLHLKDGELIDLDFNKEAFPLDDLEIKAVKIGDVNDSAIGN